MSLNAPTTISHHNIYHASFLLILCDAGVFLRCEPPEAPAVRRRTPVALERQARVARASCTFTRARTRAAPLRVHFASVTRVRRSRAACSAVQDAARARPMSPSLWSCARRRDARARRAPILCRRDTQGSLIIILCCAGADGHVPAHARARGRASRTRCTSNDPTR
jgi:hypothetical protein